MGTKTPKIITPRDILKFKTLNPTHTPKELANALEVPLPTIRAVLNSSAGRVLLEEIGKDSLLMLADIRRKALNRVNDLLNSGDMPLKEEISLLRLVLTPVMGNTQPTHEQPKLVFQTSITPRGTIERVQSEDLSEMDDLPTIEAEFNDEISAEMDKPIEYDY